VNTSRNISRKAFCGLLFGLAAFAAAPLAAAPVTVKHASGETTLKDTPKKIVVFDLASLDNLDALGVPVAGVPTGVKPAWLQKYNDDKVTKVGTLFEPNLEALGALQPDLIIVGGRSQAKYAELSKLAPTIDMTIDAKAPFASARAHITTLGKTFGKEDAAKKLVADLDAGVAQLKEKAQAAGKGLLILTVANRMSAYGPGSRFGVIHEAFGVTPAVPDLKIGTHGQPVTFEFIQKTNPDWLFVIDRDAALGKTGNARKMLDNDLVGQTTAWKKNQVVYLDPANWYLVGGGATALKQDIDQLNKAFGGK